MRITNLSFYHPDIISGGAQQVAYNAHIGFLKSGHDSYFVGFHDFFPSNISTESTPITKLPLKKNEYVCKVNSFNFDVYACTDPWAEKAFLDFLINLNPQRIYIHHFLLIGVNTIFFIRKLLPKAKIYFIAHEYLSICKKNGHLIKIDGSLCKSHTPIDCIKCFPNLNPKYFSYQHYIFKRLFEVVDKIITPSKSMFEPLLKNFDIKSKLVCIPNGSFWSRNISSIVINNKSKENIIEDKVAFFGQLLEDKGVLDLLDAFKKVLESRPSVTLDIWGGNLELNSENFIKKFNYIVEDINSKLSRKAIAVKGRFKNSDVIDLMANYKTIVIPSIWPETFSLVYSEAILAGTNVVAPKIGAFIDRASHNKYKTILYEVSNTSSMAKAINFSLSLPLILNKKILLQTQINEDLSIETMTKKYLSL